MFYKLFVQVQGDNDQKQITIPAKFKNMEQFDNMFSYQFDNKLDQLNEWVSKNIGEDYYMDDVIDNAEDITEEQAGSTYIDFSKN